MTQESFDFKHSTVKPGVEINPAKLEEYYKNHLLKLAQGENNLFNRAVADRIIMTKDGESIARELYKSKVGVSFRGFNEVHADTHLRDGAVFSPDTERERIRDLDNEASDPTDKGLWEK